MAVTNYGKKSGGIAKPWRRKMTQMSWASGVSAAVEEDCNVGGTIQTMTARASNATNSITYTIKLYDENDTQLFEQSGLAENHNSSILNIDIFFYGVLTVEVTPSGDPGASGFTVDIDIHGD